MTRGLICLLLLVASVQVRADEKKTKVDLELAAALKRAGENREQLEAALAHFEGKPELEGMQFLVRYMPEKDLKELKSRFLIENVEHCYRVWNATPWKKAVPKRIFLNDVLPYVSVNERRDNWRKDFYDRFYPFVKNAKTPSEVAAILNQKVFPVLKVKYSRKRKKPDQSPYESMETGLASCSGLSIILVDACRSVGVPARFVGTALWSDRSGNHSWVEIWDGDWNFTGACEPTGNELNKAWFLGRASKAVKDHPYHAIFAASYRKTPQAFPLIWDRRNKSVNAVNVTDRYTSIGRKIPSDQYEVMLVVRKGTERVRADVRVLIDNKEVFAGKSHDEGFDLNDHLKIRVPKSTKSLSVVVKWDGKETTHTLKDLAADKLFSLKL